jgi:hypothetical protein
VLKEVHKNLRKSLKKSQHNKKISSIPTTPDLYEEDVREENDTNQNDILNDRNTKVKLKVSINETPETVQCSTRTEDAAEIEIREQDENEEHQVVSEEDEKKDVEETKKNKSKPEKDDDSEETVSIQEDISANGTTEDDEDGNTYSINEK